MVWVAISKDKKRFALEPSGRTFVPCSFNYDHYAKGRKQAKEVCNGQALTVSVGYRVRTEFLFSAPRITRRLIHLD
jgi:hypothetical protein